MRREEFQIAAPGRNSCPVLFRPFGSFPRVGQIVGRTKTPKIKSAKKLQKTEKTRRNYIVSAGRWWRLLDSNQWPHACEYSIGRVGVTFPFHPGLSCPDFVISASYPLHCLRPDFSIVGQVVGQNSDHLLKRVCGGRTVVVQLTRVKVNTGAGISCPF